MGITDPAQARALARSVIADARLYRGAALEEGRALYLGRVAPELAPIFEQELAAPPPPRPRARVLGLLAALVPLAFAALVAHWAWRVWGGASLLVVAEPPLGVPLERPLAVADGTLRVVVRARESRAAGANALLLELTALRAGVPVGSFACEPQAFRRPSTEYGMLGAAQGCSLPVPAGGIDAVRLTLRLRDPGVPTVFSGLELELRRTP